MENPHPLESPAPPEKLSAEPSSRILRWALCATAMLLVPTALFLILHGTARQPNRKYVDIVITTNGLAKVMGLPLGKGLARDAAFRVVKWSRIQVRVMLPGGVQGDPTGTNLANTLSAINKAGLLPTNKPSGPSPYE